MIFTILYFIILYYFYRTALKDGCTHVLVIRTRPDPAPTTPTAPPTLYDSRIASRKLANVGAPEAAQYMMNRNHVKIYADDMTVLTNGNRACYDGLLPQQLPLECRDVTREFDITEFGNKLPVSRVRRAHLMAIAPSSGSKEVDQLATKRDDIVQGMVDGATAVLEAFGSSMELPQEFHQEALEIVFPHLIEMSKSSSGSNGNSGSSNGSSKKKRTKLYEPLLGFESYDDIDTILNGKSYSNYQNQP